MCLNIPRFWLCRRVSALNFHWSGPSESQDWRGLQKVPMLFLSQSWSFCRCLHSSRAEAAAFVPHTAMHPSYPWQAGTEEMLNQDSSCTANILHLSLDANSGSGFFIYFLFQVLCKASCLFMWQPGGPFGCSAQCCLYWGQPANRSKTENLRTKRLLLPRTIEYGWNIKEFLVTVWGRERILH